MKDHITIKSADESKYYEIILFYSENRKVWSFTEDGKGLQCDESQMYEWLDEIFKKHM